MNKAEIHYNIIFFFVLFIIAIIFIVSIIILLNRLDPVEYDDVDKEIEIVNKTDRMMKRHDNEGLTMRILDVKKDNYLSKPQIDYFIRSNGDTDLEEIIRNIHLLLGSNKLIIYPRYIVRAEDDYCINNSLCVLNEEELYRDVKELCAYYYKGIDYYYELVMNNNIGLLTEEDDEINRCFSEEFIPILRDERRISTSLNITEQTLFINGIRYESYDYNIVRSIVCDEFEEIPAECLE